MSDSEWADYRVGQHVKFYTGDGWKAGTILSILPKSIAVFRQVGSTRKNTRIYDARNIKPA